MSEERRGRFRSITPKRSDDPPSDERTTKPVTKRMICLQQRFAPDGKLVLNPVAKGAAKPTVVGALSTNQEEPKVYYENEVLVVDSELLVNPEAFIEDLRQPRMNELML